MSDLMAIQVNLPRNKVKNLNIMNSRFLKMGFKRLDSIKKESLPVIQNTSILKRYKTQRSQQKQHYTNEFEEFQYGQSQISNSSMKSKRQIQPLCIYKKPKIKDSFIFYRKKLLPKVRSIKKSEDIWLKQNIDKNEFETQNSIRVSNQSIFSFNDNQLITFYPSKLQQRKN